MFLITLEDLIPLTEYEIQRERRFREEIDYLDTYRRVALAPGTTLLFENRRTLCFRIQEWIRTIGLNDPGSIASELPWFNQLLPGEGRIQAALLWNHPSLPAVLLHAGEKVSAGKFITPASGFRSAHWIEFAIDEEMESQLSKWEEEVSLELVSEQNRLTSQAFSHLMRESLLEDLSGESHALRHDLNSSVTLA